MMPHAFNPSMREAEARGFLGTGCHPELHSETLSQKSKQQQQPGPFGLTGVKINLNNLY